MLLSNIYTKNMGKEQLSRPAPPTNMQHTTHITQHEGLLADTISTAQEAAPATEENTALHGFTLHSPFYMLHFVWMLIMSTQRPPSQLCMEVIQALMTDRHNTQRIASHL